MSDTRVRLVLIAMVAIPVLLSAIMYVYMRGIEENRLFPFYLPWDDVAQTVISLASMRRESLNGMGRVYIGDDGHFYVKGKRIRFLGVNIVGSAAFPRKEDAGKIAARLAKFGVNIVRFHHMDASWASPNIFDESKGGTRSCLLYTSPSPRDISGSRMPSSA